MAKRDGFGAPKKGKKSHAPKGSGGKRRRGLAGRGATPKAENRPYHVKHKERVQRENRAQTQSSQKRARQAASLIQLQRDSELIVGRNAVLEVARSKMPMNCVYVAGNLAQDERLSEVVRIATERGTAVLEVPRRDLDIAAEDQVHQGIGVEVAAYDYCDIQDIFDSASRLNEAPLIIMLDGVTDPHNLGAVLRSAAAFGAHGVVVPSRRSAPMNATAWKVSAGAAAHVPVAQVPNLVNAIKQCQEEGCFVLGLDGGGDATVKTSNVADGPVVLVTGAEGSGLSRLVRETCDVVVSIPIRSQMESLNAAVATGIALYDVAQVRSEAAQ